MYACDYLHGRYVSINLNRNNYLQLCEVEVFGFLTSNTPNPTSTNSPTESPTVPSRSPTTAEVPHPNSENTDVLEFWKEGSDESIEFLLNPHYTTPEVDSGAAGGSRMNRIKLVGSVHEKAMLMAHVLKKKGMSNNIGEIHNEF
mmetsp:Transcript_48447/g.92720  ORF Transcript_48447/g.92720 Transcript_48447/m.92720 type:complete len:144 (+) Transcript_48447:3-434(+)